MNNTIDYTKFKRFDSNHLLVIALLSGVYLLWCYTVLGFRSEHFYLTVFCVLAYFGTAQSRKFLLAFTLFVIYWIIYDSMRIYPNYMFNPVHIVEPYEIEKSLFGFNVNGQILTPNEYFRINHWPVVDILSGIFYISWVPVPLIFAAVLFFMDKSYLIYFATAFLFCNLIGFTIYYIYPAAPPWYLEIYGFKEQFNILGSAAGLENFDTLLGVNIFKDMYVKGSNVFAAIPSLHSAYPVILVYFAAKKRWTLASFIFTVQMFGIWFSAVYTRHHYIIDVIFGILCALTSLLLFEYLTKNSRVKNLLEKYIQKIR